LDLGPPVDTISAADDVTQVVVVPPTSSAALLWRSDAIGRDTVMTLLVAKLVTPVSVFAVMEWIYHGCYI
jgi:hypothetical protein